MQSIFDCMDTTQQLALAFARNAATQKLLKIKLQLEQASFAHLPEWGVSLRREEKQYRKILSGIQMFEESVPEAGVVTSPVTFVPTTSPASLPIRTDLHQNSHAIATVLLAELAKHSGSVHIQTLLGPTKDRTHRLSSLFPKIKKYLSDADFEWSRKPSNRLQSGERWRHAVEFIRFELMRYGFIEPSVVSGRGYWQISKKGRQWLEENVA